MAVRQDVNRCSVFGHDIAYQRQGAGETVLLVHGITTYSFIWQQILPRLSADHDVIAVDLLGCGQSDKPLSLDYSIQHHAELLKEFVSQLGIDRFHYVGHDIGGGIGQIFAVRYPERLLDLTLINSVAYDFWPVQPIIAMRTPIIRQLAMATLDFGTLKLIVKRAVYYDERVTPELMEYFWQPMRTAEGRKAFLHLAKCLDNRHLLDIEADLRELQMPVLIIRGDADPYLSAAIAERLHSEIPGSVLVRIATGSHFVQVDEPELVVDNLERFFAGDEHGAEHRREM